MIRSVLLFFLLTTTAAGAAPCQIVPFYDGFSGQFYNTTTVTGFVYGLDETFLYVTLINGGVAGFTQVPQQVAQSFNYSSNPDNFYTTQLLYRYHQPIMTEKCLSLATEKGFYILAR